MNDGARLARLSYVVIAGAKTTVGSGGSPRCDGSLPISKRTSRIGLGVVVNTRLGWNPSRLPSTALSHAWVGYFHLAISSHQMRSDCGPRSESGSCAPKRWPTMPLGHVSRRFEGSYLGRNHGGEIARMPDSPSTITSRTSAASAPIRNG